MESKSENSKQVSLCFKIRQDSFDEYIDSKIKSFSMDLVNAHTKESANGILKKIQYAEAEKARNHISLMRDIHENASYALMAVHLNCLYGKHPVIEKNERDLEIMEKAYQRKFHPTPMQQIQDGNITEGLRHIYHNIFTGRYEYNRKVA